MDNILFELETSWASSIDQYKWMLFGSKGAIYQKGNIIIYKFFNESNVKIVKRKNLSYLSNEKINWKTKKIKLKNNNDIKSSSKFYSNLIIEYKQSKEYNKSLNKALETVKFLSKNLRNNER